VASPIETRGRPLGLGILTTARLDRILVRMLRSINSRTLGALAISCTQLRGSASRPGYKTRRIVDLLQPADPLGSVTGLSVPIDIVTITARDTFDFAETSLLGAISSSANPVRNVYAIVPDDSVDEAKRRIPSARIIADSEVLPPKIFQALGHFSAIGRENWVLCQILGMYFARMSDAAGVLVVDADTYFLRKRTWLDSGGNQVLSLSYEYHEPYEDHCERLYGPRKRHFGLSYVTHYMLMQPAIVQEIFPNDESFITWINAGNPNIKSAVADYHTYGRWLVDNHLNRARFQRWDNNRFVWPFSHRDEPEKILETLRNINIEYMSASSHRYLEK